MYFLLLRCQVYCVDCVAAVLSELFDTKIRIKPNVTDKAIVLDVAHMLLLNVS